tara:strand:+ start:1670 stop:2026 length:357 start_codon:yes stop_codon:yes gene_type:complete
MVYKKNKRIQGKNKYYSVSKKLLRENKTSLEFETILNTLTLEELIALKLELSMKIAGTPIYGIPLWRSIRDICKDAMLKLALSATRTKKEAANFLGITSVEFKTELKRREIESFFEEN